ncbi:MAG: hypothetical protein ACR2NP_00110 [Pirellulaceae bacterium]
MVSRQSSSFAKRIANSAGFWMFVFCALGLAGLLMADSKFRERMQRQALRVGVSNSSEAASPETAAMPGSVNRQPAAPVYSLALLHGILAAGAICGLAMTCFTVIRITQAGDQDGETASRNEPAEPLT